MKLSDRLTRLETSSNGSSAEVWVIDLFQELQAAKAEGREPAPRRPTLQENTEVVVLLKKYGINPVIDTGENDW